jgi:hypothetical protein
MVTKITILLAQICNFSSKNRPKQFHRAKLAP